MTPQPVIGYRAWRVDAPGEPVVEMGRYRRPVRLDALRPDDALTAWLEQQTLALRPVSFGDNRTGATPWRPGIASMSCPAGHKQPHRDCSCGLYAWASLSEIKSASPGRLSIFGAVIAWGHIVVHGNDGRGDVGFRAQHARIVAIARKNGLLRPHAARIAERFAVPLVALKQLEQVAQEFGVPL